jgi:hypothetical protein
MRMLETDVAVARECGCRADAQGALKGSTGKLRRSPE